MLNADLSTGPLVAISSFIFSVRDASGGEILTEIVPLLGDTLPLRILDQPINLGRSMRSAKTVECQLVSGLGNVTTPGDSVCLAPVVVDTGVDIRVGAIELSGGRIAVRMTADIAMYPALLIQNFHGERLYVRNPLNDETSSLRLSGMSPQTVLIDMPLQRGFQKVELGVDRNAPLATLCLKT